MPQASHGGEGGGASVDVGSSYLLQLPTHVDARRIVQGCQTHGVEGDLEPVLPRSRLHVQQCAPQYNQQLAHNQKTVTPTLDEPKATHGATQEVHASA